MSRYIDADKLFLNFNDWAFAESPDERHSNVPEYSEHKIHEMIYRTINEAMSAIEQQPTADVVEKEKWNRLLENSIILADAVQKYQLADVVEVVRCKDCDFWQTDWTPNHGGDQGCHYCEMMDTFTEPLNYCGCAERKILPKP